MSSTPTSQTALPPIARGATRRHSRSLLGLTGMSGSSPVSTSVRGVGTWTGSPSTVNQPRSQRAWTMATSDRHHLFYPRTAYADPVGRVFRELPCMSVRIRPKSHILLHRWSAPPTKPPIEEMEEAIRRHEHRNCGCPQRRGR